jgi:hypothetical protein
MSNSLSRGAGAGQPSGAGEVPPPPRELLHKGENYTPTLVAMLSCSVDVPRSPAPCALTDEDVGGSWLIANVGRLEGDLREREEARQGLPEVPTGWQGLECSIQSRLSSRYCITFNLTFPPATPLPPPPPGSKQLDQVAVSTAIVHKSSTDLRSDRLASFAPAALTSLSLLPPRHVRAPCLTERKSTKRIVGILGVGAPRCFTRYMQQSRGVHGPFACHCPNTR